MNILNISSFLLFNKYQITIIMLVRQLLRLSRTAKIQHLRCLSFSFSNPKLSASAQKAVWATAIINRITTRRDKAPQNFHSKTLSQSIMDMQHPQAQGYEKFDDVNKEQLMRMLKTGIELNTNIYQQSRIYDAQSEDGSTKFILNFIVTPQIFHSLNHMKKTSKLIYGGFGISKTFSIIYYKILLEYISKFWMQAKNKSQKQEQKEKLIKQGLLKSQCWKYWYWTIDGSFIQSMKNHNNDTQRVLMTIIRKILLQQAVQLSQNEKKELREIDSFAEFREKLISHYQDAGIQSRTILDQINAVASKMRQCNAIIQVRHQQQEEIDQQRQKMKDDYKSKPAQTNEQKIQYEEKKKQLDQQEVKSIQKFQQSEFHSWIQTTQKLLTIVQNFKQIGKSYIFNSSLNIQFDLLYKSKRPYLFSFNVKPNSHKSFKINYIQYQEFLDKRWAIVDFWKFFQILLFQNLDEFKISQSIKEKNRKSLRQMFQNLPIHTYYRTLYSRQFLQLESQIQEDDSQGASQKFISLQKRRNSLLKVLYEPQTKQEQSIKTLNQLMKLFEQYCKERCTENIQKFISDKGTPEQIIVKKKFIHFLFHIAQLKQKTKSSRLRLGSLYFIKLFKLLGYDIRKFLNSRLHNKEFLPVVFSQSYIQFAWTVQQFIQICQPLVYESINKFISEFWTQAAKRQLKKNPKTLGNTFQDLLVEALQQSSQLTLNFQGQDPRITNNLQDNHSNKDLLGIICFKIKEVAPFRPYNLNLQGNKDKNKQETDKLDNLLLLKDAADKNPNQYILGKPIYKEKHHFGSKAIDFMILRRLKDTKNHYELYVFDATISFEAFTKFSVDNQRFLEAIQSSFKKNGLQCIMTYAAICLEHLCRQKYASLIRYTTASIESVHISSPNQESEFQFRIIQKLVIETYAQNIQQKLKDKKK